MSELSSRMKLPIAGDSYLAFPRAEIVLELAIENDDEDDWGLPRGS